jgi:hypothetical protein
MCSSASAFDTSRLGQGGSLFLSDIMPLIEKASKLKGEVADALTKAGQKADDVICSGARFPGSWEQLGGERVSPYECEIGGRTLTIKAKVRLTGKGGKAFDQASRDAMKNASAVSETDPTWSWSPR